MKRYAVIVAGGSGIRMGSALPKQFLNIHGKSVLWYTLHTFLKSYSDLEIILVLPAEYYDTGRSICEQFVSVFPIQMIAGGATRFDSVKNGLSLIREPSVVFIHDAVRCLVSPSLIHLCYEETIRFGSAIPCFDSKDSVRVLQGDKYRSVKRTDIKLVQTPQTFLSEMLLPAYYTSFQEDFTDDASVVEAFGASVHLIEGEANNIKITTPLDMALAEILIDPSFK